MHKFNSTKLHSFISQALSLLLQQLHCKKPIIPDRKMKEIIRCEKRGSVSVNWNNAVAMGWNMCSSMMLLSLWVRMDFVTPNSMFVISSSVYGKFVSDLCVERMTYLERKGFLASRRNDLWCKALASLDENVLKNHQFGPNSSTDVYFTPSPSPTELDLLMENLDILCGLQIWLSQITPSLACSEMDTSAVHRMITAFLDQFSVP